MANSDSREIPAVDDRGCGVTGGVCWGWSSAGGWKSSSISFWRIGTDTGKLYMLFIWPCFLYACIILKTTSVGRGVRRKGSFLPSTIQSCLGWFMQHKGLSEGRETHTFMCHSLTLSNATDDLQKHIEAVMYTETHMDLCVRTHTLKGHLSVVATIFNLTPGDEQTIIKPSSKQILVVLKPW